MENQIDVTTELITRFDALGYPCEENSYDRVVTGNFISANLDKILGGHIFNEDDVEIIRSQHFITITSTFYPTPIVFEVNKVDNKIILSALAGRDGEEIFSLTKEGETITNTLHDRENFIDHEYEVRDFEESTFTYTKYEVDNGVRKVMFQAYLRALGAKYRDREVFELTRVVPPEYREASLLKRIVDGIKGDNYISIVTSSQTFETLVYTDSIFNRLELESRKVKTDTPEQGQVLQKK